ncbi:MAG: hypothetical protein FWG85_07790 [Bacteroidetes bacterium]|nr:hypothetical protein [Bacteroidota bacterium]
MKKRFTTPSFAKANATPPRRGTVPLLWRGRGGIILFFIALRLFIYLNIFLIFVV